MATAVSRPVSRPVAAPQLRRPKHRLRLWAVGLILLFALGFVAYTAATLGVVYSTGQRTGYVQKLSRKGWICKTYEGELAMTTVPGTAPQIFHFSVRDSNVAREIDQVSGTQVVLDYDQHVGVPTNCFGETQYFVTRVRKAGQ
jgi:hypothetical protein